MSEKQSNRLALSDYLVQKRNRRSKLDDINKMIDWRPIENKLKKVLKRTENAVGKPAYPGLLMFKCLVLQRMYNLSDIELENQLYDRNSFSRFIGLSMDDDIPDSITICRFRNELVGTRICENLFQRIMSQIKGIGELKKGICVDATIVESSRRPIKTLEVIPKDREEPDQEEVIISYSDDTEAAWIKKGNKSQYGYKLHMASDSETGLVLGGHITPANKSDMNELEQVLTEIPDVEGRCFADKGYASAKNREIVKEHKLKDGIMHKAKRGKDLSVWEKLRNRCIIPIRSGIERIFGTFKRSYGFTRSQYVGKAKVEQEFYIIALAYNLTRLRNLCLT